MWGHLHQMFIGLNAFMEYLGIRPACQSFMEIIPMNVFFSTLIFPFLVLYLLWMF